MIRRVTVTLPAEVLEDIGQFESNRSKFIGEAVYRELERRHREELRRSLESPHAESREVEALGFSDWSQGLPQEDGDSLLDPQSGRPLNWIPDRGWMEPPK